MYVYMCQCGVHVCGVCARVCGGVYGECVRVYVCMGVYMYGVYACACL